MIMIMIVTMTSTMIMIMKRTERSPIRSVIIRVITKSDNRTAGLRESDLFITTMITDRIGQHKVLLTINYKSYNFRQKKNSQVMK